MKRTIWAVIPALTALILWGCGGEPSIGSGAVSNAGSGNSGDGNTAGKGGKSSGGGSGINVGKGGGSANCPSSCEELDANCGTVTDTKCGGVVKCGTCDVGQRCGAAGPNRCGTTHEQCTPKTCADLPDVECGLQSDGCNGQIDCGTCPVGQSCGFGGPSKCGDNATCTPVTCDDLPDVECGMQSDNCGGQIDCGTCPSGQSCGFGGPDKCGANTTCTPKTCAAQGIECGAAGDTCGAPLECGTCPSGQTCGAGGPGKCGADTTCKPKTCIDKGLDCGTTDDGCGNLIDCGNSCPSGQVCHATTPNKCGEPACEPTTCSALGLSCGPAGDGCGRALNCGTCPSGQTCGGGGYGKCGTSTTCSPKTCADQHIFCGAAGDLCGNGLDCGGCPTGQQCIALSGQTQCVTPTCTPKTCAQLGVECGSTGDGCGGTLNCGNSCVAPQACGGDPAKPGKCGCTGVCKQVPTCIAGTTTSISGKVYDPGGRNPLYNALVYIPNNPSDPGLLPFATRTATCDLCGATAAGNPLVSVQTGVDGSFTLKGVPTGTSIKLVVQLGRWRRIFTVDIPNACVANTLPNAGKLTLPKNKAEGDIPLIATVTGAADGMECMLWKAGIDTAEFTNPGGTGRVHMYRGSGAASSGVGPGTKIDNNTPSETALYVKTAGHMPLTDYDMLVLACQGSDYGRDHQPSNPPLANWQDLVSYTNTGGRVFATHWSHSYMRVGTNNPLATTATWRSSPSSATTGTGTVVNDPAKNPRQADFKAWLQLVSALNTPDHEPCHFRDGRSAMGRVSSHSARANLGNISATRWHVTPAPALHVQHAGVGRNRSILRAFRLQRFPRQQG